MVMAHPYNTWPLRVTLFTEEAVKAWNNAGKAPGLSSLPRGLEVVTELEGVDGKSGKAGTGRTAPIDVSDSTYSVTIFIITLTNEALRRLCSALPF